MMLTVWALMVWVKCAACDNEPWAYEVYETSESCAKGDNHLHTLWFPPGSQWRCVQSTMFFEPRPK
jgi:hypothetical protein